ncbi:MAG: tRNA pseudouridine(13) synthase TruD [Methanotrichaceae archaeon]|nr:tRNA pseudouridine(13) synthase TruD [Methanotrichaceae archaeon]
MLIAPEQDRALGMEYYITDAPGCGGILRSSSEDFVVDEVYENLSYEGGRYLVLEVEKKDWDTHHLIREMSRQLRISQKRFGWAGTKDKRAVTSQRISIMNLNESELQRITLPDLKIKVLGRTNRSVGLGDLLGNKFRIKIREPNCNIDPKEGMAKITREIQEHKGVPNYFGVQRFGEARPVTHRVGEALVRGKIEEAVLTYLAMPFPGELESTREARRKLWENRDVAEALKSFPDYLHYEVAMLNYLVSHPGDYAGSFGVLSQNLRRLFVHAYQSYLFNKILSRRLAAGLSLNRAVDGDVVCFVRNDLPDTGKLQAVTDENLDAVNRLVERGRAYVTLPLIGFESTLAKGAEGEIERSVLREEGVSPEDFRIPANPDLGSRGARRAALLKVSPQVRVEEGFVELEFFLPAGSYATVVLREYMKTKGAFNIEHTES